MHSSGLKAGGRIGNRVLTVDDVLVPRASAGLRGQFKPPLVFLCHEELALSLGKAQRDRRSLRRPQSKTSLSLGAEFRAKRHDVLAIHAAGALRLRSVARMRSEPRSTSRAK